MRAPSAAAQRWAAVIRDTASEPEIVAIIAALNQASRRSGAKQSEVIIACAMILGQTIAGAETEAPEMSEGIHALIDNYAMRAAVMSAKED